MSTIPFISSQILSPIIQFMDEAGLEKNVIAQAIDLDLTQLANVDHMIRLDQYIQFMESAAVHYNLPHFGLQAARKIKTDALGPIGFLFASAPTLRDAIDGLAGYISALQEGTSNRLSFSADEATLEYKILKNSIAPRRQDAEYSQSVNFELIKNYVKSNFKLSEVRFEHELIGSYSTYSEYYDCNVFFEQPNNSIVFHKDMLEVANPSISKKLYPILSAHLQNIAGKKTVPDSWAERVNEALSAELIATGVKAEQVASILGLTASTLARKLKSEGTSFSELMNLRKLSLAKRLLQHSKIPISQIALQVGYTESASFTRAFKTNMGVTPDAFRQAE